MRALFDLPLHETPVGLMVALGPCDGSYDCSTAAHTAGCFNGPPLNRNAKPGDVLAVVETEPVARDHNMAAEPTRYLRTGFVRVVEVRAIVDGTGAEMFGVINRRGTALVVIDDSWLLIRDGQIARNGRGLPDATPGGVALVVEPWCETCGGSKRVAGIVPPEAMGAFCLPRERPCPDCSDTPTTRTDGGSGPGIGTVEP